MAIYITVESSARARPILSMKVDASIAQPQI